MGLSVSASRGLWPGCGYGPRQQRLRLTGAVHNALWCTSNCPDISLNWANAPPALQSTLLALSPPLPPLPPPPSPPSPKAWAAYPEISSCCMVSSAKARYYFNLISFHLLPFFFSSKPLLTANVFIKSEHTLSTGDHLFCFVLTKGVVFMTSWFSNSSAHAVGIFSHSALCKMWF